MVSVYFAIKQFNESDLVFIIANKIIKNFQN